MVKRDRSGSAVCCFPYCQRNGHSLCLRAASTNKPAAIRSAVVPGLRRCPSDLSQKSKSPAACQNDSSCGEPAASTAAARSAACCADLRTAFAQSSYRETGSSTSTGHEQSFRRPSNRAKTSASEPAESINTSWNPFTNCRATKSRSAAIRMASSRFAGGGASASVDIRFRNATHPALFARRIASYTSRRRPAQTDSKQLQFPRQTERRAAPRPTEPTTAASPNSHSCRQPHVSPEPL